MKRIIAIMLALLTLAAPCALADLQRGDENEDVRVMQELLADMGFLFAEADGAFGAVTEAAVKEYQRFAGFEPTGVATPETLDKMQSDWYDIMEDYIDVSAREWYDFGHSGGELLCGRVAVGDGGILLQYCGTHAAMLEHIAVEGLTPEEAEALWSAEVDRLYRQWASMESGGAVMKIKESRELFFAAVDSEEAMWNALMPGSGYALDTRVARLEEKCAELCGIVTGMY